MNMYTKHKYERYTIYADDNPSGYFIKMQSLVKNRPTAQGSFKFLFSAQQYKKLDSFYVQ